MFDPVQKNGVPEAFRAKDLKFSPIALPECF